MTVSQMKLAVDQIISQKIPIERFTFCGGEPVLHKDLQQFIYEVDRLPNPYKRRKLEVRILSNGMAVTQKRRDSIHLPPRFRWSINPLDDIDDPYSGKNDPAGRYKGRVHLPFWISPADVDIESNFESCGTRKWCGAGLDSRGWSACGKAVMFSELFGMDTDSITMKEGDIVKHVKKPIDDICKHCQYGITTIPEKEWIVNQYRKGDLQAVSETFEEAFAKHNSEELIQLEEIIQ